MPFILNGANQNRLNEEEKSLRHVAMVAKCLDLNKPWPMAQKKRNENVGMNSFPAHDWTQEQNSSPYFSSIVGQGKWPSLSRKFVKIQIMILSPW